MTIGPNEEMDIWLANNDASCAFTGGGQTGGTGDRPTPAIAFGIRRRSLANGIGTRDAPKRAQRIGAGSGNQLKTAIPVLRKRRQSRFLADVDLVSMPFEELGSGPIRQLDRDAREWFA